MNLSILGLLLSVGLIALALRHMVKLKIKFAISKTIAAAIKTVANRTADGPYLEGGKLS